MPDWLSPTVRARFVRRYLPSRKVVPTDTERYRAWWDAQNESALAADGPLWVAFGDSIAQSIGASTPDRGYVGLLLARLRAADGRPWRVLNVAFSGARLGDVRRKQMQAAWAFLHTAEVVTCGIGVNDLIHSGFRHAPGRIRAVTRELPSHAVISTVPHGFSLGRTMAYNAIVRREARTCRAAGRGCLGAHESPVHGQALRRPLPPERRRPRRLVRRVRRRARPATDVGWNL